jgi:hypothetical protein
MCFPFDEHHKFAIPNKYEDLTLTRLEIWDEPVLQGFQKEMTQRQAQRPTYPTFPK